jgi:hypothetical protein
MMVGFGDAALAKTAMLGARRLQEFASSTNMTWMKQSMVVWVERHVICMILRRDVAWVGRTCQIKKQVREKDRDSDDAFCESSNLWPCLRDKHVFAHHHDEQEEDLTMLIQRVNAGLV